MPKRVFTEAQKEANCNSEQNHPWRVAAKEKGPEYEGKVEESDIIMTLSEPCAVGNLFQVKAEEKDVVDRLFSGIGVDL